MSAALPDARERAAALDLSRHVLVMAPAGSGKTGLLVSRLLRALASADEPEQVVAITFTNKAAAEIRHRVAELLDAAARGEAEKHEPAAYAAAQELLAQDRARNWRLRDQPQRLRATTIDSFNGQIAAQLPLLSGLGGPVRVAEDAWALYAEAVTRLFAELEDDQLPEPDREALEVLLRLGDNRVDRLIDALAALLSNREQWLPRVAAGEADADTAWDAAEADLLAAWVGNGLRRFCEALGADHCSELCSLLREGAAQNELLAYWAEVNAWPEPEAQHHATFVLLANLLLLKDKPQLRSPRGINKNHGFIAKQAYTERFKALLEARADDAELANAAAAVRLLPQAAYPQELKRLQRALRRVMRRLAAHLRVVFGESGQTDFPQVAQSALAALRPAGVSGELFGDALLSADRRIRHLLVDEMQDTSEPQVELLRQLTAGWQPGDGRSLFLVGDPQQSIYAFRKAEVRLFLQLWETQRLGELPLSCLRLSANFRSSATVVSWFNAAFERIFPKRADAATGAVPFAPSAAQRPAVEGGVQTLWFGADEEARSADEAAAMAAELIRSGSVAVLGRSRSQLAPVIRALRARGLTPACQDVDALSAQPAVRDVVALARALWHPSDRLHWAVLLRAPFVGLSWADLVAVSAGRARLSWPERIAAALAENSGIAEDRESGIGNREWSDAAEDDRGSDPQLLRLPTPDSRFPDRLALSPDGRTRLLRLQTALESTASEASLRAHLAERTEALWHRLGGPDCVTADELADVQAALRLLREHSRGGGIDDVQALERALAMLYAEPRAGQVQVMTVHKAKGLEFDHVLLVGCNRKPRGDDKPLWHLKRVQAGGGIEGELLVPKPPEAFAQDHPAHRLYDALHDLQTAERANETLRLLYVAVTRAKRSLRLYCCADPSADGGPRLAPQSFAERLAPVIAAGYQAPPLADGGSIPPASFSDQPPATPPRSPRLPASWHAEPDAEDTTLYRPETRRTLKPSESVINAAEDKREERVAAPGDLYAQLVGTLYHESLERIAQDGFEAWADGGASRRTALGSGFRRLGLSEPQVQPAVDRVLELVARSLASPTARWLLSAKPWARNEYHLAGYHDGRWVSAVIDRCFEDEDGALWVVDYKTAARTVDAALLEGYVSAGVEKYRGQIAEYARLLAALRPGREVKAALYFAEADRLVEVP